MPKLQFAATRSILPLAGIDHTRWTFYHSGIQRRLTNVHGRVLNELLA